MTKKKEEVKKDATVGLLQKNHTLLTKMKKRGEDNNINSSDTGMILLGAPSIYSGKD